MDYEWQYQLHSLYFIYNKYEKNTFIIIIKLLSNNGQLYIDSSTKQKIHLYAFYHYIQYYIYTIYRS